MVGVSRLVLHDVLELRGNLWPGPWSYRLVYLLVVPPLYYAMLLVVGTLLGKHDYFKRRILRPWSLLRRGFVCLVKAARLA